MDALCHRWFSIHYRTRLSLGIHLQDHQSKNGIRYGAGHEHFLFVYQPKQIGEMLFHNPGFLGSHIVGPAGPGADQADEVVLHVVHGVISLGLGRRRWQDECCENEQNGQTPLAHRPIPVHHKHPF